MKKNQGVKKGFTLIELIVVIAILGILAAVLLPKFSGFTDNAREKTATSEASSCYTAMSSYYAEEGKYPKDTTEIASMKALSDSLKKKITNVNPSATESAPKDDKGVITDDGDATKALFTYTGDKYEIFVYEDGTMGKVHAKTAKKE